MTLVSHHPPGETAAVFEPGDILLCRDRGQDWLTNLIQAGERARYGNVDAARWDHSALIANSLGVTIEAEAPGVLNRTVQSHHNEDYVVIHVSATGSQRELAVAFAQQQVGAKYGKLTFVGLAIQALTGWNFAIHMDKQFICSELVARATEKYIVSYQLSPDAMTPTSLALYWGVESGEGLIPLGRFARFLDALRTVTRTIFKG